MNVVLLKGSLAREPEGRALATGEQVLAYEVDVVTDRGKERVPVVWHDPPRLAPALTTGAEVIVTGRVRRRFFRAGGATISRTEVVADAVVSARRRQRSLALVERALSTARDAVQAS